MTSTQHATMRDRPGPVARCRGGIRSAARREIARALFHAVVTRLPVRVGLPDGRYLGTGALGAPVMVVTTRCFLHQARRRRAHRVRRVLPGRRLGLRGPDQPADRLRHARRRPRAPPLQQMRLLAVRRHPATDAQTRDGARRNISRHYDLSNEFFALFLDETMTYSSALFETAGDGTPVAAERVLAQAQRRKIDRLLDQAGVGPGSRLLEMGTGWGELAIRAGQRGAAVRTVTISARQRELAARRVAEAGLAGRVSVELRDYRDVDGQFDAICSVEMIEAVGERYWDTYSPSSTSCSRPAAGSPSRRSRCRTTGCWPAGIPIPGSRSTSSLEA